MFFVPAKPILGKMFALGFGFVLSFVLFVLTAPVSAAPANTYYRTLNLNDRLAVHADNCALIIKRATKVRIVLRCRGANATIAQPETAAMKTGLTLHADDRVIVKGNNSGLEITVSRADKIVIQGVPRGGIFVLVSVSSDGTPGNSGSYDPSMSADGRFIVFQGPDNLVPSDSNNSPDIFLRDMTARTTTLVSVASNGAQGNGESATPAISADGRYVAFYSFATNLVKNDANNFCHNYDGSTNCPDIFVHDTQSGKTKLVSIATDGTQGNAVPQYYPAISGNGRYVAFTSEADNLVPDDTNQAADVFVHDMKTGQTTRVSVASDGAQANGWSVSTRFALGADGRFVAFDSSATNLVGDDTNNRVDVFVRDMITGQTVRASVGAGETQANNGSGNAVISGNGNSVAFLSGATNLVEADPYNMGGIFVHDMTTGQTTRVSVDADGKPLTEDLFEPAISYGGRYVVFRYIPYDPSGEYETDLFLFDSHTGKTTLFFGSTVGDSGSCSISADGHFVAFWTWAARGQRDRNYRPDIYRFQR